MCMNSGQGGGARLGADALHPLPVELRPVQLQVRPPGHQHAAAALGLGLGVDVYDLVD